MIQGERGGLYYVPGGEDDEEEDGDGDEGDGDQGFEPGEDVSVGELEPGMEVSVFGTDMRVQEISDTEGPNNDETAVAFENLESGEDQFFFADLLEGEVEATDATAGEDESGGGGAGGSGDAPTPEAHDTPDPEVAEQVGESFTQDADKVVQTGTYGDFNYAVTDSWDYGGMWDFWNQSPTLIVSEDTWESFNDEANQYLLEHERQEMQAALDEGFDPMEISACDVVGMHHDTANQRALETLGEEAVRNYAEETYRHAIEEGDDPEQARHQAAYVISGVLDEVDVEIEGERLTQEEAET